MFGKLNILIILRNVNGQNGTNDFSKRFRIPLEVTYIHMYIKKQKTKKIYIDVINIKEIDG